ncbi:MAG: hypothetical protein Unbinned3806contig1000_73 [Prokaryotic dsDNA virus sp.]|nr:MAG: hypothetical protein Unbinned3806contig1000_73 [Prokaryotic dsDNA virus sp.]|tara:strand:+ start:7078 stop:7419 length:342 start_codon:yes stop_codon:yes gene_type:complete
MFELREAKARISKGLVTYVLMTWDQCGPCRIAEKVIRKLAGDSDRLHVLPIDHEDVMADHFTATHSVKEVPTLLVFKGVRDNNGKPLPVARVKGVEGNSEETLTTAYKEAFKA